MNLDWIQVEGGSCNTHSFTNWKHLNTDRVVDNIT